MARLVDVAAATASNDDVTEHARDAETDVIEAGREWPAHSPWPGSLVRLLIIVETVALAASVAVALHYRAVAGRLHHSRASATRLSGSPSLPVVTVVRHQLPPEGTIAGTVTIIAAAQPGAARAQFVVSAVITGGRPGTVYDLTGNDCSAAAPMPDHVWASGPADAAGMDIMTGYAWTGAVADEFWLALAPWPVNPPPGLHGPFAQGTATPFPAGQAPCATSP